MANFSWEALSATLAGSVDWQVELSFLTGLNNLVARYPELKLEVDCHDKTRFIFFYILAPKLPTWCGVNIFRIIKNKFFIERMEYNSPEELMQKVENLVAEINEDVLFALDFLERKYWTEHQEDINFFDAFCAKKQNLSYLVFKTGISLTLKSEKTSASKKFWWTGHFSIEILGKDEDELETAFLNLTQDVSPEFHDLPRTVDKLTSEPIGCF